MLSYHIAPPPLHIRQEREKQAALNPIVFANDALPLLSADQLIFGDRIGKGSFASVCKGTYQNVPVAIKQFYAEDELRREAYNIAQFNSPFLLKASAYCFIPPSLVVEYCEKGSLHDLINSKDKKCSQQQLISIVIEVAKAMRYMHIKGFVHRDIKSKNVLLDAEYHVKLADFGTTEEEGAKCEPAGTLRWMAPEVGKNPITKKHDIYSFGILLLEIASGDHFFDDVKLDILNLFFGVPPFTMAGINNLLRKIKFPEEFKTLVRSCTDHDPNRRPTAEEVVQQLLKIQRQYDAKQNVKLPPLVKHSVFAERRVSSRLSYGKPVAKETTAAKRPAWR